MNRFLALLKNQKEKSGRKTEVPAGQHEIAERMAGNEAYRQFGLKVAKDSDAAYDYLAHQAGVTSEEIKKQVSTKAQSLIDKSDVYMRLRSVETLGKVLDSGRFKNQHETKAAEAVGYTPEVRRRIEAQVMGAPEDVRPEAMPVYGYFSEPDFAYTAEEKQPQHYGGIVVHFKPSVKERATVTFGDSMAFDAEGRGQARPVSALDQLAVPPRGLAGSKQGLGVLDSHRAWDQATTHDGKPAELQAIEAQIHDGLDLDEVDEIRFPHGQEVPEEIQTKLKNRGIKWSTYGEGSKKS